MQRTHLKRTHTRLAELRLALPRASSRASTSSRTRSPPVGRRDQILTVATALFARHGVHAVTTRQIASALGISQPSLYAHFASITDIQDEVSIRPSHFLESSFGAATDAPPQTRLRQAVASYFDFGLRHPDAYRVAFMLEHPKAAGKIAADPDSSDTSNTFADAPHSPTSFMAVNHPGPRIFGHLHRIVSALRPEHDVTATTLLTQSFWACLHSRIALQIACPQFPWADQKNLLALHSHIAYQMIQP